MPPAQLPTLADARRSSPAGCGLSQRARSAYSWAQHRRNGRWHEQERARRDRRDRERLDSDGRRLPDRRAHLAAQGRRERARAGDPRVHPLPQARLHAGARRADPSLFRPGRLCRGAGRPARLGGFRRHPARRVHPAGAGRRARDHRLDRRPALVRGRGRHDGDLLGRLQRAPGRSARPAGAQGDHHAVLDRRPLRRRRPLHGRLPAQREPAVGLDPPEPRRLPARPRDRRRALARDVAPAHRQPRGVPGALAAAPVARRLLAPRLGLRGLRRDQVRRSTRSAAGRTAIPTRCRA